MDITRPDRHNIVMAHPVGPVGLAFDPRQADRDTDRECVLDIVPLYLHAADEYSPQLKRVIAVTGDQVMMQPTLDEAMANLFIAHKPLAALGTSPSR